MPEIIPFQICLTKRVVFKDWHGTVQFDFPVGHIMTATAENDWYFVASPGGIYKTEAVRISTN